MVRQPEPLDCAGWAFGQFVQDVDHVRGFEIADPGDTNGDKVALGHAGAGPEANGGLDLLAIGVAGPGENGGFDDIWIGSAWLTSRGTMFSPPYTMISLSRPVTKT